jgi:hypothetical protein
MAPIELSTPIKFTYLLSLPDGGFPKAVASLPVCRQNHPEHHKVPCSGSMSALAI